MSDCLFCRIVRGEIPSTKVYEDEDVLAFKDIHPLAPVHFLVIPKRHIESLATSTEDDTALLVGFVADGRAIQQQFTAAGGFGAQ